MYDIWEAHALSRAGEVVSDSRTTCVDRVVLGPSDDGGYYLIGVKKPLVLTTSSLEDYAIQREVCFRR